MAMKVADFFAAIGVRVSKREFAVADGMINRVGDRLQGLETKSKKATKSAVTWSNAWKGALYTVGAAWAAVHIVKSIGRMSDSYNAAASRVRLLTDDVEKQKEINEALYASAQNTGSAFADVAQLYQQVGKAAVDNGKSLEEGVAIVDTINKALKASGAGGEAGAQALRQLAQGLGSGTLRGEEFNSVIEQAPFLLDIIAKDIGKTRGQMRKLAEGGKLTSKVILGALERQKDAVDEAYAKRIPLMSEHFARLQNQIERAFGEMMQDKATAQAFGKAMHAIGIAVVGVIKAFAALVVFFAKHEKVFYATLIALAAGFIAVKFAAIAAWAAVLGPIALVVGGLALIALNWEEIVGLFFAGFMTLGEGVSWFISKIFEIPKAARAALNAVGRFVRAVGRAIGDAIRGALDSVVRFITDKVNWLIDKVNFVVRQINKISPVDIGTIDRVGGSAAPAATFTPIQRSGGAPTVNTGPISANFTINGAGDPNAVADAASEKFRTMWGNELRTAMDTVG